MKVEYNGELFDSQLEVDYYKYLMEEKEVIDFIYHPKEKIYITDKNKYTPDFIVIYDDRIEIIETKGYNQFSFARDNIIHSFMKNLKEEELKDYVIRNNVAIKNKNVVYRKIKYLSGFGWVDFDFKNPNTISNKRKEKILTQTSEIKDLRGFLKDYDRFYRYLRKSGKITKKQEEWLKDFCKRKDEELGINE